MQFLRQFVDILLAPLRLLMEPQKILAAPRKLLHLSLPAGVATIVFIFLVVCVITVCVAAMRLDEARPYFIRWVYGLWVIVPLVILIPIFTYFGVRLWLEGEISAFDDIDRAWAAGIAELERNGLDIREIPLFLVLGSEGEQREQALFAASRLSLTVGNFPPGPGPLHWYANNDGVYLVLTRVGCLSRMVALAHGASPMPVAPGGGAPPAADNRSIAMTMMVSDPASDSSAEAAPQAAAVAAAPPPPPPPSYGDIRGTMFVGSADAREMVAGARPTVQRFSGLSRDEIDLQSRRLDHVCRLILQARRPLCPINGVLTLLPLDLILADRSSGAHIKESVRTDTKTLVKRLKIRCPVTALVLGLEDEPGFHELISRVGRERAVAQRFGKGFGVWDPPTSEAVGALCQHACGAFEDWVYHLFREPDSLSKPGNRALYGLLCKIRRDVEPSLDKVLVEGFTHDPEEDGDSEALLFSGCYFAAAGDTEDRQAFVKQVFDKLPEQQEELEWTAEALGEDMWYERIAYLGLALDALLLASLGFLIYWKWWRN